MKCLTSQALGHDADLGGVVISHPSLSNASVVPLQPWEQLNADVVMGEIAKVLNSKESLVSGLWTCRKGR